MNINYKNIGIYIFTDIFTERMYDSFKNICNKYYNDIILNIKKIHKQTKTYKRSNNYTNENIISIFNEQYTFDYYCSFCLNPKQKDIFIKLDCGHQMHYNCFKNFILNYNYCPFCKENILIKNNVILLNENSKKVDKEVTSSLFKDLNINDMYYK
jgi:hypothetical protein